MLYGFQCEALFAVPTIEACSFQTLPLRQSACGILSFVSRSSTQPNPNHRVMKNKSHQQTVSHSIAPNRSVLRRPLTLSCKPLRHAFASLLLLALLILGFVPGLQAALETWTGLGADSFWGTAGNWGGTAPVNGDDLLFSGSTRLGSSNSIVSLRLNSLSYNSSGFTNIGQALMITNGIVDIAGGNTNLIAITLGGSQSFSNQSSLTLVLSGTLNMSNYNLTASSSGGGNLFLNGVISGNGLYGVNALHLFDGITRLGAANTFNGGVDINPGATVLVGNAGAFPNGAGVSDVTNNGTINLNGISVTVNGLYGSGGVVDNQTGTATYTLTIGNNSTNSGGSFSGTIQNTSGNIALTKVNTNTFKLDGAGNYSGATLISAGQFVLGSSGSLGSTPSITVSSGATFDISASSFALGSSQTLTAGRSTNGGPSDVVGDPLSTGAINIYRAGLPGTLTLSGGLTLNGGTVNYDLGNTTAIGSGSNDLITLNGQLNLNAGTIKLNPFVGAFAAGTYTLISNQTALVSGSAASLTVSSPRGITPTLDSSTMPGSLLLSLSGSFAPASLVWSGASSGDWDVQQTQNWLNGGTPDYFYNLDTATFNDSTVNASVNVAVGVSPGSTTINNSASNYVFSGVGSITGSGGLTKSGTAQATFRNANSYLGNTVINGGTLFVDFLNSGTTVSQIFYNGVTAGSLVMNGGSLVVGNRGGINTYQLFGATTINPGASLIQQNTRISGAGPAIYLGAITRNTGGTADIQANTGSGGSLTVSTVGVFTTTTNINATTSGIIGGYATSGNGAEFARVNASAGQQGGTHIYGGAVYLNSFAAGTNTDMTADITAAANTNTMTVRFNTASARTLTLNGNNVITTGGILVTPTAAANLSTITGGTALTSGNGLDLIVHQYDLTGNLLINSVIANNGATPIALTKSGGGTLILGGANSFTGATYINAGTLQIGNGGTLGSIDTSTGVTNRGILAFNRTDSVTFALPITGSGALKQLGSGSVTLTANNAFSGATTISAGTLQVGTGGVTGSLGTSASIANNGTLIFNRSDSVNFAGPITGTGSVVQQGAGKLSLGGTNTYQGNTTINAGTLALGASASLSDSTAIVVAGGTAFDVSASGSFTLNGGTVNQILAGSGSVNGSIATSAGSGTGPRIMPGTNGVYGTLTITNALTLNGGTINFDISSGSKDLIVVGGNLVLNNGTIALNVSGTLPNGSYKLIQYSGAFSGSVLNLAVSGFNQSGSVALLSSTTPGEIDLVISSYIALNLVWQGNGGNNLWDAGTTADWTNNAGSFVVFHQNDNATFDDTSVNTTVNLQGALTPNQITVNGSVNSYTFQGSGSIAGGNLINNNPNTLTILTTNTYSGNTTINAGTVQFGDVTTAGTPGGGPIINNGALVFNEPDDETVSGSISGSGTLTLSSATTLSLVGNSTYNGLTTISAGILQVGQGGGSGSLGSGLVNNNSFLVFNRLGTVTSSGAISGSGSVSNIGVGTVILSANNTYNGNTVIANGTLQLGASEVIPNGTGAGNVVLDGGASAAGTLDLNGFNETINGLSGVTGTVLGKVVNNSGTATNFLAVGDGDTSSTFAGVILNNTGSGGKVALVKNGAGTLTLQPGGTGSTFSGGTTINDGIVSGGSSTTANATMLGSGPVTFGTNGALQLGGWTGSTTPGYGVFANAVIVPPNMNATVYGTCRGDGFAPSSATGSISSTLTFVNRYVRGNFAGNWTGYNGVLIVSNNAASGGNDFRFNATGGLPNARVILAPNATMYNLIGGTPIIPIGELSGDSTSSIILNSGAASGVAAIWSVGGLNTSATYDGSITGTHGIIKTGTGTWTLTSANLAYSGSTTVSNGILALGASATLNNSSSIGLRDPGILDVSAAGSFSVGGSTAQTLQGNGTLQGSLVLGASGTIVVGFTNAIGKLTVTNDVNLSGNTYMELNETNVIGGTNDQIAAATITLGGTLNVTNIGPALHVGDTFKLFKASGTLSGAFSTINLATNDGNNMAYTWTDNTAVDGSITVFTAVSLVNQTPTNITLTVSGNQLTLSWPPDHIGWRLQAQTNSIDVGLAGNWVDVAGSTTVDTMTFTIDPANGTVFYRMVYP
jgi:fibronectin-binding autotransporter adhesin